MAVSLGFGIMFATLITLILIPCNYLILEDIKAVLSFKWLTGKNTAGKKMTDGREVETGN